MALATLLMRSELPQTPTRNSPAPLPVGLSTFPGRFWRIFNVLALCISFIPRYGSLGHGVVGEGGIIDDIFLTLAFVTGCLFPLGVTAYCRSMGVESFRKPSIDRSPFHWWTDPLQPIRLILVASAFNTLSACLWLPTGPPGAVREVWYAVVATAGLFLGERLVYRVFAKRIV